MQLARLVEVVHLVRATTKKLKKIALLAEYLRRTTGKETELVALYLTGTLRQGKIGVGRRVIEAAMSGDLASESPLTLAEIDQVLDAVAADQGSGSTERKIIALRSLFLRATADERRFLSQLLMGEIRQGALEGLLIEAIARAAGLPSSDVRQAVMFSGNLGEVARAALEQGSVGLIPFSLRLFSPVAPMLANSAADVNEALERLGGEAAFEYKLDGARIQVHKGGADVRIFTRQLQDVTDRLPEVVEWARRLSVREVILEGEAIALRPDGRPYPFQITMRRFGRVKQVESARQEISLSPFFFDCLFLQQEGPLIAFPYHERTKFLTETVAEPAIMPRLVTKDHDEAQAFLKRALDTGHEGAMAKSLTASMPRGSGVPTGSSSRPPRHSIW